MKNIKRNFKSKLHFACGADDLRLSFQHIEFKNGFAYATNSYILIKQHLSLHDFNEEEIKHLEGKKLHKNVFLEILKYDVISIDENGFKCFKNNVKCIFPFVENDFKMTDFESVIPSLKDVTQKTITAIGVDAKMLKTISDLFIFDNNDRKVKLDFMASNKAIRITALNVDDSEGKLQVGIVMPVML